MTIRRGSTVYVISFTKHCPVFSDEMLSHWFHLIGVDARGSQILHTLAKCVTSHGPTSRLKWYGHEKRRRIRRKESDGDGGAREKKERKTKAEVVG